MTDYLITQFNAKLTAIQDSEAKALAGALELYVNATRSITEQAAQERMEAGVAHAAAMSQRDHEYHNGRPEPLTDGRAGIAPPKKQDAAPLNEPIDQDQTVGTAAEPDAPITEESER